MKKKSFDIILLTLLALCFSTQAKAWGETTSYVLQNSGGTLSTIATGPSLPLTGPGATLTYDVYTNTFLGIPGVLLLLAAHPTRCDTCQGKSHEQQ